MQFPDGTWNLPPGIDQPAKKGGGLKVRVGEVVLQQGIFALDGDKVAVDVALEDFNGNLASIGEDHYTGALTRPEDDARPSLRGADRFGSLDPLPHGAGARDRLRVASTRGILRPPVRDRRDRNGRRRVEDDVRRVGRRLDHGGRADLSLEPRIRRGRADRRARRHSRGGRLPHRGKGDLSAHRREGLPARGRRNDRGCAPRGARRADREGTLRGGRRTGGRSDREPRREAAQFHDRARRRRGSRSSGSSETSTCRGSASRPRRTSLSRFGSRRGPESSTRTAAARSTSGRVRPRRSSAGDTASRRAAAARSPSWTGGSASKA